MAKFNSANKAELKAVVANAAEISGLGKRLKDKVKTYSKGMKRRLFL